MQFVLKDGVHHHVSVRATVPEPLSSIPALQKGEWANQTVALPTMPRVRGRQSGVYLLAFRGVRGAPMHTYEPLKRPLAKRWTPPSDTRQRTTKRPCADVTGVLLLGV